MQRLQKILSQAGIASRRAAERLIADGRVSVNGHTVQTMGVKADPATDDIRVDGRRIKAVARLRYILLNKPKGYVTTRSDPQRRSTVIDLLHGVREYIYPVGRLDYDSEGLLLLTNDGDLAARLTHPRHGFERTYEARVAGMPDEHALERLRSGIPLDGHRTMPATVVLVNERRRDRDGVLLITIREGRNRQVRRMCEAVGHPVQSLKRTRIGPIADRRLKTGEWRELTPDEVAKLKSGSPGRGRPSTTAALAATSESSAATSRPERAAESRSAGKASYSSDSSTRGTPAARRDRTARARGPSARHRHSRQ